MTQASFTSPASSASLAGLILAAGLSSRMGAFKPLLPIGGRPMLARTGDMLRRAGAGELAVVTGHRGEELVPLLAELGAVRLHNADYAVTHMFDSIKLGLAYFSGRCERLLITPADNPLVRPSTVEALLALGAAAARPVYQGRPGHPVLIEAALFPWLLAYDGPGGLGGALAACGQLREATVDDPGVDLDADRPADYQRLLAHFAREEQA